MKIKLIFLLACIVSVTQAYAVNMDDSQCCPCKPDSVSHCCEICPPIDAKLWLDNGVGWRLDQFKFGKMKWKSQNMGLIELDFFLLVDNHYLVNVSGDYARSFLSTRKGEVNDISGSLGYLFNLQCYCHYPISFSPLLGYSSHHQRYKAQQHHFKNTYDLTWNGPWVGFAILYDFSKDIHTYFDYQFHWNKFHSKIGEKNDLEHLSFHTNSNDAYCNQVTLAARKKIGNWFLGLRFEYKGFWTEKNHRKHRVNDEGIDSLIRRHSNIHVNTYYLASQIGYEF